MSIVLKGDEEIVKQADFLRKDYLTKAVILPFAGVALFFLILSIILPPLFLILTLPLMIASIVVAVIPLLVDSASKSRELIVTDKHIYVYNDEDLHTIERSELINTNIEISMLGSFLKFGDITLQTKKNSIVVKSVKDPNEWKSFLYSLLES